MTTKYNDGRKGRSMGSGELKRQCSLGLYVDRDLQRFCEFHISSVFSSVFSSF